MQLITEFCNSCGNNIFNPASKHLTLATLRPTFRDQNPTEGRYGRPPSELKVSFSNEMDDSGIIGYDITIIRSDLQTRAIGAYKHLHPSLLDA
jgi:hypothetical protein